MSILEMKAERARVWEQMKSLAARAEDEKRALSGEEQVVWDRMEAEMEDLRVSIEHKEKDERLEALRASLDKANDPQRHVCTPEQAFYEKARALFRGDIRTLDIPLETRTALQAAATPGSYLVPVDFVRQLKEYLRDFNGVRQTNVTVINTAGGEELRVPVATAHAAADLEGETDQIAESEPTFVQKTLGAYKYANLQYLTAEFLQDEVINVLDYLARQNGMAIAVKQATDFIQGAGSTNPTGMCHASAGFSAGVTGGAGTGLTVTGDDLINLYHSVYPGYRRNGMFLMNDATVAYIRRVKVGTTGAMDQQYLWQPGLQAGQPDLLLGKPVIVDAAVPVMAINAKSILFGDFSAGYMIRDVGSLRVERSDDFKFDTDVVTLRTVMRSDGEIIDAQAVKAYKNGSS